MKAIRQGPSNRGPFPSAIPTEANPNAFPPAIWVTTVDNKRKSLERRLKTQSRLFRVRIVPVVVVVVRVKPIKIVSLTKLKKFRPLGKVVLGKVFGHVTSSNAFPRDVQVTSVVRKRSILSKFIKNKSRLLTKPVKQNVVVVRPQKLKVIAFATLNRPKKTTHSRLNRPYGKPTTKTAVRGPRVLSYSARQAEKKARYVPVRIIVGRIPRTFGSSPTGSTVIFFDGLNVAGGLNYHKDLSRPHLILIANGDGTFTVFKDRSLTDEKADSILKETYLIDGDIP